MFKPTEEILIKSDFTLSSNTNFSKEKVWVAKNGERLVSRQELDIYNLLLEQEGLHVEYEKAFDGEEKTLYPDFTVTNLSSNISYVWEHLGMTNNENYLNNIPRKIEWYRKNGLESIEQPGGKLIITFYNQATFYKDVQRCIRNILRD